jgi:cation:H+ antiporter
MTYLLLLVGLGLLVAGAESLVRGGVALALRLGVTPLLIGLTVVAYGTSAPELFVSVDAALVGASGIAVGNAVGSNIANILLILGIVGLISPIRIDRGKTLRDLGFAGVAALAFLAIALTSDAVRWFHGLAMLTALVAMGWYTYGQERLTGEALEEAQSGISSLWGSLLAVAVGLGLLVLGAKLLVDSSVEIARAFGVSEAVIGLTLVAVGTSLPELATSVVAAFHKKSDISMGNILGSNIFNMLLILGVASLLGALPIPEQIARVDGWIMLAATAALLPAVLAGELKRWMGGLFLAAYAAYILSLFPAIPS